MKLAKESRELETCLDLLKQIAAEAVPGDEPRKLTPFKHPVTGFSMVMPACEMKIYLEFMDRCLQRWKPVGAIESFMCAHMGDSAWRLSRYRSMAALLPLEEKMRDEMERHVRRFAVTFEREMKMLRKEQSARPGPNVIPFKPSSRPSSIPRITPRGAVQVIPVRSGARRAKNSRPRPDPTNN